MPNSAPPLAEILLVDDDPGSVQLMVNLLKDLGRLRFATRADEALLLALELPPDLILLDAEMPGMSGYEVCEALKAEPGLAEVPVIFVTAHAEPDFEVAGFRIGAADFIAKPVHAELLRARVQAQLRTKRMADEQRRLSRRDALTGLPNAESLAENLPIEWRRAQRDGQALALLRAEVDGFEAYAQHYGDAAAKQALCRIADSLQQLCARPADRVVRGADAAGFAVLLPGTDREGAQHLGHHLLEGVEALGIAHAGAALAKHLTLSLGLACCDARTPGWQAGKPSPWRPEHLHAGAELALRAAQRQLGAQGCWVDVADHGDAAAVRDFDATLRPQRAR